MDKEEFEALTTDEAFRKAVLSAFEHIRAEFAAINLRMSNHDVAIAENTVTTQKVFDQTKGVREFMANGAEAAKFFCRLAKAWRFLWRSLLMPVGIVMLVIYSILYYSVHRSFPMWVVDIAHIFM